MGLVNTVLRRWWTGSFRKRECPHLDQIQDVTRSSDVCEECVALGDTYPEVRMCLGCGYIGCCDGSKNKHSLTHFEETGHPIMTPPQSGIFFRWIWYYVDKALLDPP